MVCVPLRDENASAAFIITNTPAGGRGRDVVIDKITVRGRKVESQYIPIWKVKRDTAERVEMGG